MLLSVAIASLAPCKGEQELQHDRLLPVLAHDWAISLLAVLHRRTEADWPHLRLRAAVVKAHLCKSLSLLTECKGKSARVRHERITASERSGCLACSISQSTPRFPAAARPIGLPCRQECVACTTLEKPIQDARPPSAQQHAAQVSSGRLARDWITVVDLHIVLPLHMTPGMALSALHGTQRSRLVSAASQKHTIAISFPS